MSFRFKTILGLALIEVALLGLLVWSSLSILHRSSNLQLVTRATTTATLFATTTQDAVLSTDLASLESFVTAVLRNPGLVYARVLDSAGRVLAEGGDPAALSRPFIPDQVVDQTTDGVFDVAAPIEGRAGSGDRYLA